MKVWSFQGFLESPEFIEKGEACLVWCCTGVGVGRVAHVGTSVAGWERYNRHGLYGRFVGLDLCYADPVRHLTTAGYDLDLL